jgi:hypothetical protein
MKTKITIPFGTNLAIDGNSVKFLENRVVDCINIDKGLNLNIDKDNNLVIHDYGITALDEVSSNHKITIPFNTDFEQLKKNVEALYRNTSVLTSDENEKIPMSIADKNFLEGIEETFNTKIEEYDKALNQVTPEFRCAIDNYSIKFHKPNNVIGEPENMGDSDGQIILPFNFRLDYTEDEYILHQPGEVINNQTLNSNNQILIEYGTKGR